VVSRDIRDGEEYDVAKSYVVTAKGKRYAKKLNEASKHVDEILEMAADGVVTRDEIVTALGVSSRTADNVLDGLDEMGLITEAEIKVKRKKKEAKNQKRERWVFAFDPSGGGVVW